MKITKPTFIEKNLKYIAIGLLLLFLFTKIQSCNRNMTINILNKDITQLKDSLNSFHNSEKTVLLNKLNIAKDSIKELNFEIRLAQDRAISADKRANAVQSTAEKIRDNTTINIENKNSKNDTITVNKKKK